MRLLVAFLMGLWLAVPVWAESRPVRAVDSKALKEKFSFTTRASVPGIERAGATFETAFQYLGGLKGVEKIALRTWDPIYEIVSGSGPSAWAGETVMDRAKTNLVKGRSFRIPAGSVGAGEFRFRLKRRVPEADEPWMTLEKERRIKTLSVDEVELKGKELGLYDVEFEVEVKYSDGRAEKTALNIEVR
ncbi:MAG: hypothetical protein HYT87_07775 [Nitrospirae bacterium]|nr:hypothetical protein [Nitrospirota bacterium]